MDVVKIPLDRVIPRAKGQREKLAGIEDLADSISRIGLIHPITIDADYTLVAGGCRLEAFRALRARDNPHTGKWDEIPVVFKGNLSDTERLIIELEENVKRVDLSWQEHSLATIELDTILRLKFPLWTAEQRAYHAGCSYANFNRLVKVGRALQSGHERVKGAGGLMPALNILEREANRSQDNVMNKLFDELTGITEEPEAEPTAPTKNTFGMPGTFAEAMRIKPSVKPSRVIFQQDFIQWAEGYSGPRFNLVHCDFPYGINHGKSDQGGAKDRWDSYEDSPDIYFKLIRSMLAARDRIMAPSAHMIFWLSARFSMEAETRRMFAELAPDCDVDEYKLIWHKTDNKGIIRNVQHTPRHVYETALFVTRGNRQIIKAVGDVYGAPTGKSDAIHISEKPVPVLRHFFQLCVDGHSEVLDPTAGSGSALRAASSMGARRVLGLELNGEYADSAQREWEQAHAIELLRKTAE